MSKNNKAFKIILFILGILLILSSTFFLESFFASKNNMYITIAIALLIYIACFFPFVFDLNLIKDNSGSFVGFGIYYKGLILFIVGSACLIYFVNASIISIKLTIFILLILVFILFIFIFLSFFTKKAIKDVHEYENNLTSNLKEINKVISVISINSNSLSEDYKDIKDKIDKLKNDFNFLSPSNNTDAYECEQEILFLLNNLTNANVFNDKSFNKEYVNDIISKLDNAYQRRKGIL